jgi:hypothetical protein
MSGPHAVEKALGLIEQRKREIQKYNGPEKGALVSLHLAAEGSGDRVAPLVGITPPIRRRAAVVAATTTSHFPTTGPGCIGRSVEAISTRAPGFALAMGYFRGLAFVAGAAAVGNTKTGRGSRGALPQPPPVDEMRLEGVRLTMRAIAAAAAKNEIDGVQHEEATAAIGAKAAADLLERTAGVYLGFPPPVSIRVPELTPYNAVSIMTECLSLSMSIIQSIDATGSASEEWEQPPGSRTNMDVRAGSELRESTEYFADAYFEIIDAYGSGHKGTHYPKGIVEIARHAARLGPRSLLRIDGGICYQNPQADKVDNATYAWTGEQGVDANTSSAKKYLCTIVLLGMTKTNPEVDATLPPEVLLSNLNSLVATAKVALGVGNTHLPAYKDALYELTVSCQGLVATAVEQSSTIQSFIDWLVTEGEKCRPSAMALLPPSLPVRRPGVTRSQSTDFCVSPMRDLARKHIYTGLPTYLGHAIYTGNYKDAEEDPSDMVIDGMVACMTWLNFIDRAPRRDTVLTLAGNLHAVTIGYTYASGRESKPKCVEMIQEATMLATAILQQMGDAMGNYRSVTPKPTDGVSAEDIEYLDWLGSVQIDTGGTYASYALLFQGAATDTDGKHRPYSIDRATTGAEEAVAVVYADIDQDRRSNMSDIVGAATAAVLLGNGNIAEIATRMTLAMKQLFVMDVCVTLEVTQGGTNAVGLLQRYASTLAENLVPRRADDLNKILNVVSPQISRELDAIRNMAYSTACRFRYALFFRNANQLTAAPSTARRGGFIRMMEWLAGGAAAVTMYDMLPIFSCAATSVFVADAGTADDIPPKADDQTADDSDAAGGKTTATQNKDARTWRFVRGSVKDTRTAYYATRRLAAEHASSVNGTEFSQALAKSMIAASAVAATHTLLKITADTLSATYLATKPVGLDVVWHNMSGIPLGLSVTALSVLAMNGYSWRRGLSVAKTALQKNLMGWIVGGVGLAAAEILDVYYSGGHHGLDSDSAALHMLLDATGSFMATAVHLASSVFITAVVITAGHRSFRAASAAANKATAIGIGLFFLTIAIVYMTITIRNALLYWWPEKITTEKNSDTPAFSYMMSGLNRLATSTKNMENWLADRGESVLEDVRSARTDIDTAIAEGEVPSSINIASIESLMKKITSNENVRLSPDMIRLIGAELNTMAAAIKAWTDSPGKEYTDISVDAIYNTALANIERQTNGPFAVKSLSSLWAAEVMTPFANAISGVYTATTIDTEASTVAQMQSAVRSALPKDALSNTHIFDKLDNAITGIFKKADPATVMEAIKEAIKVAAVDIAKSRGRLPALTDFLKDAKTHIDGTNVPAGEAAMMLVFSNILRSVSGMGVMFSSARAAAVRRRDA